MIRAEHEILLMRLGLGCIELTPLTKTLFKLWLDLINELIQGLFHKLDLRKSALKFIVINYLH